MAEIYKANPRNPLIDDYSNKEYEVEKILAERVVQKPNQTRRRLEPVLEYLVQWVGYDQPTWEPLTNLENCKDLLTEFFETRKNNKKFIISKDYHKRKTRGNKTINKRRKNNNKNNNNNNSINVNVNNILINNKDLLDIKEMNNQDNKNDINRYNNNNEIKNKKKEENKENMGNKTIKEINNLQNENPFFNEIKNIINEDKNKNEYNSSNFLNNHELNHILIEKDEESINKSEINSKDIINNFIKNQNKKIQKEISNNSVLNENNDNMSNNNNNNKNDNFLNEESISFEQFVNSSSINCFGPEKKLDIPIEDKDDDVDSNKNENFLNKKKLNDNNKYCYEDNQKCKIQVLEINGLKIPNNIKEKFIINITYKNKFDNKIYTRDFETTNKEIPKECLVKYYEHFLFEKNKGQSYNKKLLLDI